MKPTKIYTFTVPGSGTYPLLAQGEFFKIIRTTGDIEVRGDTFGTIGLVLPGQGLTHTPFNRLEIRDLSGSANIVTLLVADEAFVDDRITGEVSVIDGSKARTMAGVSGFAVAQTPPIAARFSVGGVWNPAGSGRRVIIKRAFVSTLTAQVMYFGRIAIPPFSLSTPTSMLFDGSAFPGAAKSCGEAMVALGGLTVAGVFSQSVSPVQFALDEPVVVRPGFGFVFAASVANTDVTVTIPFFEEAEL